MTKMELAQKAKPFYRHAASNKSLDVRQKPATLLKRSLVSSALRVAGFCLRQLRRYVA